MVNSFLNCSPRLAERLVGCHVGSVQETGTVITKRFTGTGTGTGTSTLGSFSSGLQDKTREETKSIASRNPLAPPDLSPEPVLTS